MSVISMVFYWPRLSTTGNVLCVQVQSSRSSIYSHTQLNRGAAQVNAGYTYIRCSVHVGYVL